MATMVFCFVLLMSLAHSAIVPALPNAGPAYATVSGLPTHAALSQSKAATILAIPFNVLATSDDQADDIRPAAETARNVVAKVAEKVADVVADVKDKVADVVDDIRDKVADVRDKVADVVDNVKEKVAAVVDDAKIGGSSRGDVAGVSKGRDNSNETAESSDELDAMENQSDEMKGEGGNSTDTSTEHVSKVKDDDDDDNKRKNSANDGKSSTEKRRDDSSKEIGYLVGERVNGTQGSEERSTHESREKKIDNDNDKQNHDDDSREKGDGKSTWSWLKGLTGEIENESGDDDVKIRRYLAQISQVKGYLDAIDSSIAISQAKQSGTCPVYPIQVGNNRVTITTQDGCKIIIRLKGLTVDKIEDGHEEKKQHVNKRSIMVSYADN